MTRMMAALTFTPMVVATLLSMTMIMVFTCAKVSSVVIVLSVHINNLVEHQVVDIFYDGDGKPDGPGHSHAVVDRDDVIKYMRQDGEPHTDPTIDYDGGKDYEPRIK